MRYGRHHITRCAAVIVKQKRVISLKSNLAHHMANKQVALYVSSGTPTYFIKRGNTLHVAIDFTNHHPYKIVLFIKFLKMFTNY